MKISKALFLVTIFCFICSCCFCANVELCKPDNGLKNFVNELEKINKTKADITILGIYIEQNNSKCFEPCFKNVVFNCDTPTSLKLDVSGISKNYEENVKMGYRIRNRYDDYRYSLAISCDLTMEKNSKSIIAGSSSKPKTILEALYYDFVSDESYAIPTILNYEKQEAKVSNTIKKFTFAFKACCEPKYSYFYYPAVLKPYVQNLIFLDSYSIGYENYKPTLTCKNVLTAKKKFQMIKN